VIDFASDRIVTVHSSVRGRFQPSVLIAPFFLLFLELRIFPPHVLAAFVVRANLLPSAHIGSFRSRVIGVQLLDVAGISRKKGNPQQLSVEEVKLSLSRETAIGERRNLPSQGRVGRPIAARQCFTLVNDLPLRMPGCKKLCDFVCCHTTLKLS
jgi:hypothetical protein